MKQTITTLITAILLISVYSCSKNSDSSSSTPVLAANQVNVSGTIENFTVNTHATKIAANSVTFQANSTPVGSSYDQVYFTLTGAASSLAPGTYKLGDKSASSLTFSATLSSKQYSANYDTTNTITITENDTLFVGSYNAKLSSNTDSTTKTLTGKFSTKY